MSGSLKKEQSMSYACQYLFVSLRPDLRLPKYKNRHHSLCPLCARHDSTMADISNSVRESEELCVNIDHRRSGDMRAASSNAAASQSPLATSERHETQKPSRRFTDQEAEPLTIPNFMKRTKRDKVCESRRLIFASIKIV